MIDRALVFLVTLALTAAPALAQEHGGEHGAAEGGGISPFSGDVGNALWTLIIFALVLFVLGKFAWGPILSGLQTRENFIRESLEAARRDREQAEARLREYEERLATARAEATAIVDEGRRDAEVVKRRVEEETKAEADRMIERARREIQIATESATKDLYRLSTRLATDMATRIVGRELSPQDHERLIAEAIRGVESSAPRH